MNRAATLLLGVGLAVPGLLRAGVDTAWVRRYDGPAHSGDVATELAVDSAGNVYVAGYSAGTGTGDDFVTIKYYPNGDTAWVRRRDFGSDDTPTGLGVDGQGNVYVTGWGNGQIHTVKYGSGGQLLWSVLYGAQGSATDLALDAVGNVMLCGNLLTVPPDSYNLATVKYRPSGDTAWVRVMNWAGHTEDARALAVGPLSDVAATAERYGSDPGGDYLVVRYDSTGIQQWVSEYRGPANWDSPQDVAMDSAGNVYVTGSSEGTTSPWDYLTIKYDLVGETLWTRRYNGPANGDDEASAVAVDSAGNAYVTGSVTVASGHPNCATIKYSPDGQQLWVALFGGPIANYGRNSAVALDGCGGVYVCGVSAFAPGAYGDYATIKYSAATGDTVWVRGYNGPGSDVDLALAIAVDPSGSVYVTGESYGGIGTGNDIATIKYVQNGGAAETRPTLGLRLVALAAEPSVFCRGTSLRFSVETATLARVLVFDAGGRRVRTLVSGAVGPGLNAATWDGCDDRGIRLPPGVYVIVLEAGQERAKVKVVMSE